MRKENNKTQAVTYIRVRELFHAFLRYKYGDFPLSLPEASRLYGILSVSLVSNYRMCQTTYSTFSEAAFNFSQQEYEDSAIGIDRDKIHLPGEEDRKKLVPIVMPLTVISGGKLVQTNQWFQVSNSGYTEMSKAIESEFWNSYVEFDQKFILYCCRSGEEYTQDISIEKFMQMIGMDLGHKQTLLRAWRRKKKSDSRLFSGYNGKEKNSNLKEYLEMQAIMNG